jgi:hypothetical protein
MTGFLLLLLLLLVALGAGVLMLILARTGLRDHPSCGACGGDVSEAIGFSEQCPGCGRPFAETGIIAPGQMRRPAMLGAGLGLLIVSLAGLVGVMILTPRTASDLGASQAETVKEHLRALKARGEAEAAETALDEARREEEAVGGAKPADEAEDAARMPEEEEAVGGDAEERSRDEASSNGEPGGDAP